MPPGEMVATPWVFAGNRFDRADVGHLAELQPANTLEMDNDFHLLGYPHGSSRPSVAIMTVCDSRGKLWYD